MSVPRADEQTGGALFQPSWAQAYLRSLFQQRGINPSSNMWARQVLDRASQATYMMNAMGLDENQARGFLQSWMNGRWGGGDQTFQGTDLSRAGMSQWLDTAMRSTDQSTEQAKDQYAFFNTGDPQKDYQNLQAAHEIRYGGRAPGYQQAHQRVLDEWFGNAQAGMLANPAASTNTLDWWYNRAPTTAYGAQPPPGTPGAPPAGGGTPPPAPYSPTPPAGQPPVNPNMTTFPSVPGDPWNVRQPTTPPARGAQYGLGPPVAPPAQSVTDWQALLNKYRADQRNWGTEGFRPTPGGFTLGGVTYDPTQDRVTGYKNMSGQGRITNRGNFMGQFLKYLQLLMDQRKAGGNRALGFDATATDDQLARIAAQRMQANAVGSTGISILSNWR